MFVFFECCARKNERKSDRATAEICTSMPLGGARELNCSLGLAMKNWGTAGRGEKRKSKRKGRGIKKVKYKRKQWSLTGAGTVSLNESSSKLSRFTHFNYHKQWQTSRDRKERVRERTTMCLGFVSCFHAHWP